MAVYSDNHMPLVLMPMAWPLVSGLLPVGRRLCSRRPPNLCAYSMFAVSSDINIMTSTSL